MSNVTRYTKLDGYDISLSDVFVLASAYEALEAELVQVIREVLLCDPQPASSRADDKLEPPWEVIARVRTERDTLRKRIATLEAALGDSLTLLDHLRSPILQEKDQEEYKRLMMVAYGRFDRAALAQEKP